MSELRCRANRAFPLSLELKDRTRSSLRKNGIVKVVSRMASSAVEIVMPMRCVNCDREGPYVCSSCEPSLPRLRGDRCRSCATPGPSWAV